MPSRTAKITLKVRHLPGLETLLELPGGAAQPLPEGRKVRETGIEEQAQDNNNQRYPEGIYHPVDMALFFHIPAEKILLIFPLLNNSTGH